MSDNNNLIGSIGKAVLKAAKSLGQILVIYESSVCYQCKKPVHPEYDFCSEACTLEYWKKCRDQYHEVSDLRVCSYPGCSKPCYKERGRAYDYCSKTHAIEHKKFQDWGQGQRLQQHQSGSSHQGKHHHGNSPHNHHQNTRTQSDHSSSWWPWSSKPATGPINFYNRDDPYYEFTNSYNVPVEVDKKTWPTTEHYFQAQKFVGTPYEEQIRHLPWPQQVIEFTQDPKVSRWRRNDWKSVKKDVMYKALLAKFTQHNDLRKLLLGTGERKLIDHNPYDSYWGDGGDGTGKNRLGELLMRLRCELKEGREDNLQHSTLSGQRWAESGSIPFTSEHGGHIPDSHLLRRPLREQSSHPDDPVMDYQLCNAGDNTTGRGVPGHIQEPASRLSPSTDIRAECTMQPSFDNSQHNQMPQQRRDSATHDEKVDFTEEVVRENLKHFTLSEQRGAESGSISFTSEHGGHIPDSHLPRPPLQKQSSHPDDPVSNAGDNTTGRGLPGHIQEPASHLSPSTDIRAGCTMQPSFDNSQQQPHQPANNTFGTISDESHPSTVVVQPSPTFYQPLLASITSSTSQEENRDFSEVAVPPDQQCKLKGCTWPRYVEPGGRVHNFCGKTHARQHAMQQLGSTPVPAAMQCKTPGCSRHRRKMDNGSGYYDYCSISCRDQGQQPSGSLAPSEGGTCSFPGCTCLKYVDPANNRTHDFCGRTHAFLAQEQGIALDNVTIRVTASGSEEFTVVSGKFQRAWVKGSCPPVSFIFVINNRQLQQRWSAHQQKLSVQTVEEHYHGTVLLCDITTSNTMCNDKDCGICGISRTGFDQRYISKNIDFQRFGHGFYVAPNSSKCHDYTQGAHGYRAMLLCDVCPGRKYVKKRNDEKLQGPPPGYDSVHGQGGSDSVLNYDEVVVYNPDSVLPRYVIVYQLNGTKKIAQSRIKSSTSAAQTVPFSSRKRIPNIGSSVRSSLIPSSGYHKKRSANTGSAAGKSYSVSELGYASSETWKKGTTGGHTTSHHTSYQPQSSNSRTKKDASTGYASSSRSPRPFSHVNDDSALLFHTPPATLSSRKRSANLTNIGTTAGQSYSQPSASELDYASSETWKKGTTGSHTTSHHTSYQPQSILKKNKGTSPSYKHLPSHSSSPQYSKPPTSSQYHPKPSVSLPSSSHFSSTTSYSQPSYSTPLTTSTCEPASKTVRAVASPMLSQKTTKNKPSPANPPPSSSSSVASSRRIHTNQSSIPYNIITGKYKYY